MTQRSRLDDLVASFENQKYQVSSYIHHLIWRLSLRGKYTEDDILGEVALVACQKIIRSPESLPREPRMVAAWLMRMALFICLNHLRKTKRERLALMGYENVLREHELLNVIEEDPAYLREEIREFLKGLNTDDRKLLELYLQGNLTSSEIAHQLGIEPAAARQRKARLLARMHTHLMR